MIFNLYGLLIGIGIWVGATVAGKAQKLLVKVDARYGDLVLDTVLLWMIVFGLIGARTYHVIDYWQYYSQNLIKIPAIWEGGIGIYGGLVGGLIGILLYLMMNNRKQKTENEKLFHCFIVPLLYILDTVAIGLPLAQAIGRWGNYFNQELFGLPTSLPWGIFVDAVHRPAVYADVTHYHPLFLYESLLNLGLFVGLWMIVKRVTSNRLQVTRQKQQQSLVTRYSLLLRLPGIFIALYLIGYGVIRFSLEYLRIDPWRLGWLTTAQWVSVMMILLGAIIFKFAPKYQ